MLGADIDSMQQMIAKIDTETGTATSENTALHIKVKTRERELLELQTMQDVYATQWVCRLGRTTQWNLRKCTSCWRVRA